jgi:hypothetical protein
MLLELLPRAIPPEEAAESELIARAIPSQNGTEPSPLLIDMAEAMKLAAVPICFPIHPIAARGFLTVLAGRHSSLKSWLMMISGHVAHRGGGELAGLHCEATTVLYVDRTAPG